MLGRTYLDHAATTPLVPAAVEAVSRELSRVGNASSLHGSGRSARRVVEESREAIAARVGAKPYELIFTSGGTEADNLAVKGAFWSAHRRDPGRNRLVSTTMEHHAVLDALGWLAEAEGADVRLAGVDSAGLVNLEEVTREVTTSTALVSVMWANNEVGTIQPVAEVAALARAVGALSHSDAVQAVGHVPLDFAGSGLDTLSFTAHKLGGPYGVGALLARREVQLSSLLHGGGQERDVRSGTLNVAGIAGFAAAVQVAVDGLDAEERRVRALRSRLLDAIRRAVPEARCNGQDASGGADSSGAAASTLPGVLNISFPGCDASSILMLLDAAGIDCSTGSACSAGVPQASHVLVAMGLDDTEARSSLRFSLGWTTSVRELDALVGALPEAVARARSAGVLSG